MVALKNIQTFFQLPDNFTQSQREYAGKLIVDRILVNTAKGRDANGESFKKYSNEYKNSLDFKNADKSTTPNLHLSGDMLSNLAVINTNNSGVWIGYKMGDSFGGQVEGNQIGSYGQPSGNPSKARKFIGLPPDELEAIIHRVDIEDRGSGNLRSEKESIISNLLSRFFPDILFKGNTK